jgi:chemotaxis protein CheD
MENVTVGIAEFKVVKAPNQIMTIGLGSCCGVVLYDEINKIAGLVHILLSDSKYEKNLVNKAKYADTGIILLYEEMKRVGANPRFIRAKLAGGAHMFNFKNTGNSIFTIGERNVKSCKETLAKLNIAIVSEDVLGSCGRTIIFDTLTNKLRIKSVGKSENFI